MQPAIELAEQGFEATWYSMLTAGRFMDRFARYPETAAIFFKEGKYLWATGGSGPTDRIYQKDLARTLRQIANDGPAGFAQGAGR